MANNLQLSLAAVNAAANAVVALLNGGGTIAIFDGDQPADANTALDDQELLATVSYSATAYGAASAGVCTANAITSGVAIANGTAAWYRAYKADGTTAVVDGSVGTSGCDLNLDSVTIQLGGTVAISSLTYTHPAAAA